MRVFAGDAEGELVQVLLAEHDRARVFESGDERGVGLRHVVAQDLRPHGVGHTCNVEQVFDADGDAVQRPTVLATTDLGVDLAGSLAGLVGHDRDIGVDQRVESLDAHEISIGNFDGRDFALSQPWRKLGYVELKQVCHRTSGPATERSGGSTFFRSSNGNSATARAIFAYHCASAVASSSVKGTPIVRRTCSIRC